MCGIAGIVCTDGGPPSSSTVEAMIAAIVHRGPDEGAVRVEGRAALGIRRLSVIDVAGGSQPISNEDGSVWVTLNGEIYNFEALRDSLRKKGHTFRTRSDTEAIVHAYEEYGADCAKHLRGMFAFALWDAKAERLILGRDRLGKKPLLYASLGGGLVYASEMQALVRGLDALPAVSVGALGDYLAYGYVPAPATIFDGVRKLPPGHVLVWEGGHTRLERYWTLSYRPKLRLDEAEAEAELERRLGEAVRIRLIADVPLGALLSGGVDSSVVVALMSRFSSAPVKTFSIGFEDAAFDELSHARRVAEQYSTDHHEFVVRPDAAEVLPTLVRHYGEPYADSSAIPTYYVSKLARTHVTVALNGDGGDEAFAGYDRYRAMWLAQMLQRLPAAAAGLQVLAGVLDGAGLPKFFRRAARFCRAAASDPTSRYTRWVSTIPHSLIGDLLEPDFRAAMERERSYAVERAFEDNRALGLIDQLLATEVGTYLLNDLLVKMDIASMANSLETRSPLLDHEVVEFAAQLPPDFKLRHGVQQKYLLKRLARKLIPAENIDRPKMGFGVPVGAWLRGPLRDMGVDALLGPCARQRGYFRPAAVERLWAEHQSDAHDHTYPLWTLLMLELWQREFLRVPVTV